MITALAPLGATHNINIALSYQTDGTVTATALVSLKTKDKEFGGIKPLVFSGPVAEVEAAIAEQLPAAVGKLVAHGNNLAAIDAQLAEETKAKEAEAAKKKAEKPAPKPAAAKPAAKAKPKSAATASKPKPKATTEAKPAARTEPKEKPVAPALTPAWKGNREPVAAPVETAPAETLDDLFKEEPATAAT